MKIGVIGSGLAGLSACWYASKFAQVTLIEKEKTIGIDAHSVDVPLRDGRVVRVDTPLRVLKAGYYPGLLRLYGAARIPTEIIDYSGSFCDAQRRPYFRYQNLIVGEATYSFITNAFNLARPGWRIIRDLVRFYTRGPRQLKSPELARMDFGEYLRAYNYSREFREGFILPLFAAINTCSYRAARAYPAAILIAYLVNSRRPSGVRRIVGGVGHVARTLSQTAAEIRCGFPVQRIEQIADRVRITTGQGQQEYDWIVLATEANQAARLCAETLPQHRALLARFGCESSDLVIHKDLSFLPEKRSAWSPVNFFVDANHEKPMATIYMNAIQKELRTAEPVLQTWNPHRTPAPDALLMQASFQRPLVTHDTPRTLDELTALNNDENNRIKICGSYAETGIPLLEAAAVSGEKIAGLLAAQSKRFQ